MLNNLWLKVFCKRAGKRDKITYLEAFMLLHQEEKKSEGTHFGPRATSMAGIFPLCQCPVRSQEAPLDLGNLTLISPPEPWVTLTVGNKLTDFVIWVPHILGNTKAAQETSQSIPDTRVSFILTTSRLLLIET